MMTLLYDFINILIVIVFLPVYLVRRKFHRGFLNRLGIFPRGVKFDRPVWVHSVSVGETMAVRRLIEELRKLYPSRQFVFSTVTPTGNKVARSSARQNDVVTYLPLDISFIVRSVIKRVDPSIFIIVETELWPNLITALQRRGVPVVIVNGRMSDRSLRGYRRLGFLFRKVLGALALVCVQTEEDAWRFIELGVAPGKVQRTGNLKFDAIAQSSAVQDDTRISRIINLQAQEQLIVAGSTHPGEEEIILQAYENIRNDICGVKLLLAPRHPERAAAVERAIARFHFQALRVSAMRGTAHSEGRRTIYLLDTIGQLTAFYAVADVVFVGGSLVEKGGHNILEPASLGKPVLIGPYTFNFRDIVNTFLVDNAVCVVNDADELQARITQLLRDPAQAQRLGRAARDVVSRNAGATEKTIKLIKQYVKEL